jgi:pimeloyl-ACP methyl ester carboxylesterase
MARKKIDGIGIEYELVGDAGAPVVALTPGGRYSKDEPGVPELARELAAGGKRVLLWDRPNCGLSDVSLEGETESTMHADVFAQLIRELDLGPIALAGGSAGSRISLLAAARVPELVTHLVIWWISGGPIGLMQLASYYCGDPAGRLSRGTMEDVLAAPCWAEQVRRNPQAREYLLSWDADAFIEKMQQWALAYAPSKESPVPGMTPEFFAQLKMPVLIMRNGRKDLAHTRATSDLVHELIPHSKMIDPPWEEDEWNQGTLRRAAGKQAGPFVSWPKAAPIILDFTS